MLEIFKRIKGFFASDDSVDEEELRERVDEKVDMMIALKGDNTFPPNYVKSYDEGRPRK
jgi:hypothetical protein